MHGTLLPHNVRRWTLADVEWAGDLAERYYPGAFDVEATKRWARARLDEPLMVFLRTDFAFGVAHLSERYHAPGRMQAYMALLYAEPGNHGREVLHTLYGMAAWAAEKGATKFWFGDVTGHDMNKLAKIVGGRLAGHTYVVDLDGDAATLG